MTSHKQPHPEATGNINSLVANINGLNFPIVQVIESLRAVGTPGQPFETRNQIGVAPIDLETPQGYAKHKFVPLEGPREALYSPSPSGWVISSFAKRVTAANPPTDSSVDAVPANYTFVSSSQYAATLEEVKNYVGSLDIKDQFKIDFNLKLEEFIRNYGSSSSQISTSASTIRHRARVQGRGPFNGSSSYHGVVDVVEVYCPPECRDVAQLKTTLKLWVDQTKAQLPQDVTHSFKIKNSQGVFVAPPSDGSPIEVSLSRGVIMDASGTKNERSYLIIVQESDDKGIRSGLHECSGTWIQGEATANIDIQRHVTSYSASDPTGYFSLLGGNMDSGPLAGKARFYRVGLQAGGAPWNPLFVLIRVVW